MTLDLTTSCIREIEELHAFFQAWFAGDLDDTDEAFGRFTESTDPAFTFIGTDGTVMDRHQLISALRGAHGSGTFDIWIENASAHAISEGAYLASYEEWQVRSGEKNARQSSAIFVPDAAAPNGLSWRHVHETWLPKSAV